MPSDNASIALRSLVLPWNEPIDPDTTSYYQNITGFLKGDARLYNLSEPDALPPSWAQEGVSFFDAKSDKVNMTDVLLQTGSWNLSSFDKMVTSFMELNSTSEAACLFKVGAIAMVPQFSDIAAQADKMFHQVNTFY